MSIRSTWMLACESGSQDASLTGLPRAYCVVAAFLAQLVSEVVCLVVGHRLSEELVSAESGHSVIHCSRCEDSQDCWFE